MRRRARRGARRKSGGRSGAPGEATVAQVTDHPRGHPTAAARAVAALGAAPARTALLCDFDGTLAPIVDDPAAAGPLPGAVEVLARLSERLGLVAVVSGRPVSFLTAQLSAE